MFGESTVVGILPSSRWLQRQDETGKVVGWDWCKNRPSFGGPKKGAPKWGVAMNFLRIP